MVKWIAAIELVHDFADLGAGEADTAKIMTSMAIEYRSSFLARFDRLHRKTSVAIDAYIETEPNYPFFTRMSRCPTRLQTPRTFTPSENKHFRDGIMRAVPDRAGPRKAPRRTRHRRCPRSEQCRTGPASRSRDCPGEPGDRFACGSIRQSAGDCARNRHLYFTATRVHPAPNDHSCG